SSGQWSVNSGRKIIRNYSLFTINYSLPSVVATRAAISAAGTTLYLYLVHRIGRSSACHRSFRIEDLTAVDPDLHTDDAERRQCFGESVIHIRTQRVQRQPPFQRPFGTRDLSSVQASRDHYLDALWTEAEGLFHRLLHRTAAGDTLFKPLCALCGLTLCVRFRVAGRLDRDHDITAGLAGG